MRLQVRILFLISFICFFSLQYSYADERIDRLDSTISIKENGEIYVKETIVVRSEGFSIKHGIYRDFPTDYTDRNHRPVRVGFSIISLSRDGYPEPYHFERIQNGIRTYFGSKEKFLEHGTHTYTFSYKTDRQIGFFENHDELYFNAIGTGWNFQIRNSTVRVVLPKPARDLKFSAYTGLFGGNSFQSRSNQESNEVIRFDLSSPLGPREGFTVVVEWEKGLIDPPSSLTSISYFFGDFGSLLLSFLLLPFGFWIYYQNWLLYGKDNLSSTIIPQFNPPKNISPTASRYIISMGSDDKILPITFVSLASKKGIKIEKVDGFFKDSYRIKKLSFSEHQSLNKEELTLFDLLPEELDIKQDNWSTLAELKKSIINVVSPQYDKRLFVKNTGKAALGILIPVVSVGLSILSSTGMIGITTFYTNAFSFGSSAVLFIAWILFCKTISAPTKEGKPIFEHLNGFKQYLSIGDRERLNKLNAPGDSLELFEAYLPYAIALDVANEWTSRFETVLKNAELQDNYRHSWYHAFGNDASSLSNFSSSFSSQIASSSTAPGSSSGGGGGGSSGGGGGGGGGGGW
jgi:uncharacterized membrane protein YgcG